MKSGKQLKNGWDWSLIVNGKSYSCCGFFDTAKEALEAGNKKLLELIKETFDFGNGPVPAHKHKNGGGWVADTAHVDETVFVGPNAKVYGFAKVYEEAKIYGCSKVFGRAIIRDHAVISGYAKVFGNVRVYENGGVGEYAEIFGSARLYGSVTIGGHIRFSNTSLYSEEKK